MKPHFSSLVFSAIALIGSTIGFAANGAAQECDRCSFASYLQGAMSPNSPHEFALQLDYTYRDKTFSGDSKLSGAPKEKVADTVINFFYSQPIFSRLAVDINLPIVSRAFNLRPNNTYTSERETSLGDMSLLLDVIPIKASGGTQDAEWRIRGGVKLPTGDSDELKSFDVSKQTDFGGSAVYPYDLAKGTGSTDIILGSSLFLQSDGLIGFGDVQWTARTEGENDFQYGDKVLIQAAPGFRLLHKERSSLSLLANTTYKFTDQAEQRGITVDNSGQNVLSVGPQILFNAQDLLSATLGVNFPVYRDVEGTQVVQSYEILASISAVF